MPGTLGRARWIRETPCSRRPVVTGSTVGVGCATHDPADVCGGGRARFGRPLSTRAPRPPTRRRETVHEEDAPAQPRCGADVPGPVRARGLHPAPRPAPVADVAARPSRGDCNPNYDPCVPNDRRRRLRRGSGNGPRTCGPGPVIGVDVYELDRDGDGIGSRLTARLCHRITSSRTDLCGDTRSALYQLVETCYNMAPVIAEALARTRIAITGSTGFVGTALVERLLRSRARVRAGAARPRRQAHAGGPAGAARAAQERRLRPPARRAGRGRRRDVRRDDGAADHDDRRRRRHRRPRAVRGRPGRARLVRHRRSTRRPRCRSTRRSTRPSRSTCSARRASPSCCNELGVTPAPRVGVDVLRRRQPPRHGARGARQRRAVRPRAELARRGRRRPPPARRHRGGQPPARPAASSSASAARTELGAAGAPALAAKTEQLRERWVRDRLVEAGRARAASVGWPDAYAFTKALGEQALTDSKGAVPVSIVRPSIIESAWAEPRPGWIRGFRMAEPVLISYARGLLREFPGVPEGTVDVIPVDLVVAAIITVAALGPEQAPAITQVASGGVNPLKYKALVDNVSGWFTAAPALRQRGPADRRPRVPLPRPRPRAGPADPGQGRDRPAARSCSRRCRCGASRPSCRPSSRPSGWRSSGRSSTSSCTASTPSARRSTRSTTCWRCGTALDAADQATFAFDPARRRLADVHPRDPPAVDRPARPRQDGAGQDDAPTAPAACAARCSTRPATSPPSTSRTR